MPRVQSSAPSSGETRNSVSRAALASRRKEKSSNEKPGATVQPHNA